MANKKIKKSILLRSTPENLWQTLFDDKNYRLWASCFQEGSYADTDWQLGSKTIFSDCSGFGIIGKIHERQDYQRLSIQYEGMIRNGVEEFASKEAQAIKGSLETYELEAEGNLTRLQVTSDMDEAYYEDMIALWDKALLKIKELSERELMFNYRFEVPREKVYAAWTEAEHLRHWFCPTNYEVLLCEADARPGGAFRVHMKAPDGSLAPTRGVFVELVPPMRLTYLDSWDDDRPDNPPMLVTVLFETEGADNCRLYLYTNFDSEAQRNDMVSAGIIDGWLMFMDNLAKYLSQ